MLGTVGRLLAAALPFALASCALPLPQVDDVAFVDAALVKEADIPKQDRDIVDRSRDGSFLRLTFTSSHDFQKLAHEWNYTIGWDATPCLGAEIDGKKQMDGYYGLYDGRGPVRMYDEKRTTSGKGPRFRYYIYLAVRAEANLDLPTDERQYAYDLAAHPHDVCFRIHGMQEVDGDGWGFAKFKSNVVHIAKVVVAKAVR